MKRVQLIEWGIVSIALIFGYKFFESLLSVVIQLIYAYDSPDILSDLLKLFFLIAAYFVAFLLLIRNSQKLAVYINGPEAPDNDLNLKIGKRAMLHVILIGICLYTMLSGLADIVYFLADSFKTEVQSKGLLDLADDSSPSRYKFILSSMKIVMALIVLYLSRQITEGLIRKDEADELTLDSTPQD